MIVSDLTPVGRALKVLDFLWDHWLVILLGASLAYSVIAGLGKDTRIAELKGQVATLEAQAAASKLALDTAVAGRESAETIAKERLDILERERAEHARLREANTAAIRASEAARVDAERTLSAFMDRYATEIRNPTCSNALIHMEASCSALSDY